MASHQSFTRVDVIAKAIARCVFTPGRDSTKILDDIGLKQIISEIDRGAAEDQRFTDPAPPSRPPSSVGAEETGPTDTRKEIR